MSFIGQSDLARWLVRRPIKVNCAIDLGLNPAYSKSAGLQIKQCLVTVLQIYEKAQKFGYILCTVDRSVQEICAPQDGSQQTDQQTASLNLK